MKKIWVKIWVNRGIILSILIILIFIVYLVVVSIKTTTIETSDFIAIIGLVLALTTTITNYAALSNSSKNDIEQRNKDRIANTIVTYKINWLNDLKKDFASFKSTFIKLYSIRKSGYVDGIKEIESIYNDCLHFVPTLNNELSIIRKIDKIILNEFNMTVAKLGNLIHTEKMQYDLLNDYCFEQKIVDEVQHKENKKAYDNPYNYEIDTDGNSISELQDLILERGLKDIFKTYNRGNQLLKVFFQVNMDEIEFLIKTQNQNLPAFDFEKKFNEYSLVLNISTTIDEIK
ncbi:hypothetical protein RJI07_04855 [Mycoplasmatota bacterium WC30]